MTEVKELYNASSLQFNLDHTKTLYRYVSVVERATPSVFLIVASDQDLSDDEILDAAEDETWRHCAGSYRFAYKILDD